MSYIDGQYPRPATPNQMIDNSGEAFFISPNEEIVAIVPSLRELPPEPLSALAELQQLTGSADPEEIGTNHPAYAAKTAGGESTAPSELKRFSAFFGRDALQTASSLIEQYPELTLTTVLFFARNQGVAEENTAREEEIGRIPHEVRDPQSETAQRLTAERGWGWPYYGSVDATPLFIKTLAAWAEQATSGELTSQTYIDRIGEERDLVHALDRSVDWLTARMDENPEGLVESLTPLPVGLQNQVWKDSWDSYFHADGEIANHERGIASIEVQVLAYDALLDAADMFDTLSTDENKLILRDKANGLRERAKKLRLQIFDKFWTEEKGGYFVLGTDRDVNGNLQQLKIRTSNMGHTLNSRLLAGTDPSITRIREAVIRQLFSPELFSEAGIRTLACDEARYNPGSTHNGSVWPWDTGYIAEGLRRHGYETLADTLEEGILKIPSETHLLPEYVRGDSLRVNTRSVTVRDSKHNKEYMLVCFPQEVQAWTVASVVSIMHRREQRANATTPSAKPASVLEQEILEIIAA